MGKMILHKNIYFFFSFRLSSIFNSCPSAPSQQLGVNKPTTESLVEERSDFHPGTQIKHLAVKDFKDILIVACATEHKRQSCLKSVESLSSDLCGCSAISPHMGVWY